MKTFIYQIDETTRIQINHMIRSGATAEEAFAVHNVCIELKEAVLNPVKKQVVKKGYFDGDAYWKKLKYVAGI